MTKYIFNGKGLVLFLSLFCLSSFAGIKQNLQKKYPDCKISLENVFPRVDQIEVIKKKFPTKIVSNFYSYYKKSCSNKLSTLFVFSDLVRTQKQFLLFDIRTSKFQAIEVLKFLEPSEYKVSKSWLSRLKTDIDVDGVSGATLTSKSSKFLAWLSLYLDGIIKANE